MADIHPTAFVAPTAVVMGDVTLGEESSVWYTAVLRGDTPARSALEGVLALDLDLGGFSMAGPGAEAR